MAGVKGRSGGARFGAGRPKGGGGVAIEDDPLVLLLQLANDRKLEPVLRLRAATEAAKIMYSEDGKKAAVGRRAVKATATARLTGIAPPPLKAVG